MTEPRTTDLRNAFAPSTPSPAPEDRTPAARQSGPPAGVEARREPLVPAAVWLRETVRQRLARHGRDTKTSQAEVILRSVEYAADHLDALVAAAAGGPPTTGSLFPRPEASPTPTGGRGVTLRFRADHLATLERLAADHGISRSALVTLTLTDYLDHL